MLKLNSEFSFLHLPKKTNGAIKEQLTALAPTLDKLMKLKEERIKKFSDVEYQIQKICGEIVGTSEQVEHQIVDECDLSLKSWDEFHSHLQELQKEKSERLHKVFEFVTTVCNLYAVLRMDFYNTVTKVHPSLNDSTGVQSKCISNDILSRILWISYTRLL